MASLMIHPGTGCTAAVSVLIVLAASTGSARGQVDASRASATVAQGGRTLTPLEKSLAQQQTSIDGFRDSVQAATLSAQRQSILAQVAGFEPAMDIETASGPIKKSSAPAGAPGSTGFFTVPWPGSLPLSMPNVQISPDACEPLPKDEVDKLVRSAAEKNKVDPELLRAVMKQESAFKPCALSVAGAMGLMQIMPDTADMLSLHDPFDPAQNVDAGARFLKSMLERYGGDLALALSAYNAGPQAVTKAGGVPPIAETLQYVSNILGDLPIAY